MGSVGGDLLQQGKQAWQAHDQRRTDDDEWEGVGTNSLPFLSDARIPDEAARASLDDEVGLKDGMMGVR